MDQNKEKPKKLKAILIAIAVAIVAMVIGYKVIGIIKTRFLQPIII